MRTPSKPYCPFYIGLPPLSEEKEAARSGRAILVGCQRTFPDGQRCGGSWEQHYGYSADAPVRAGSQGPRTEAPKRSRRNPRLAALEAQYGQKD